MMREFLLWWFDQLTSLIPPTLRRRWRTGNNVATFIIEGDSLHVATENDADKLFVDLPSTRAQRNEPDPELKTRLPANLNALQMRLAPGEYLVRRLTLPSSARAHLREAVGYQLPKLTPFTANQVYYACGMDRAGQENPSQNVWLVAVPRQKIDMALSMLGLNHPGDALEIEAPPEASAPLEFVWNLSPKQGGATATRKRLWIGALAVLAFAAGLHLYHSYKAYDSYGKTLQQLRKQAREIGQLQRQINETSSRLAYLNKEKLSSVSPLQVLDSLTRELDDDTWLQNLEIKGNKLVIQGLSPAPAGLIELLEGSPLLSSVRFESAITQDARRGVSRFSISATLTAPFVTEGEE